MNLGADSGHRPHVEKQPLPGASITLTLFDKSQKFITSRTEPLYSEGPGGEYVGEITGSSITWTGASIDVKVGSRVEADGRLTGAVSLSAWAAQAGKGRAAYVLVDVDAAELRATDQKDGAKPWLDEEESNQRTTKPRTQANQRGDGTNPAGTGTGQPAPGEGIDGHAGDDEKTRSGWVISPGHDGANTTHGGDQKGTRKNGHRSDGGHGDGSQHGKREGTKHDVGYFWDPNRQHDGTQDTAPDGADKDGAVGGAGKKGDHGIPDVGALKARIPVPKRIASAVSVAMILYQANIQQIAKDLVKAAEKVGASELKTLVTSDIDKLTAAEVAHLVEKDAQFEAMTETSLAEARRLVRMQIVEKLTADIDVEIANAARAAEVDRAGLLGKHADYAADDLKTDVSVLSAAHKARAALDSERAALKATAKDAASETKAVATEHQSPEISAKPEATVDAKITAKTNNAIATQVGPHPGATASVPTAKFSDYIFKPGQTNGKNAVFEGLGYTRENSEQLAELWQTQGRAAFQEGKYALGTHDQYGQRITIEIEVRGIGVHADKVAYMKSGWMILEDGNIKLNTPFSGFTK